MAFDGSGNLYVANFANGSGTTVSKFAAASLAALTSGSLAPAATLTGLSGPIPLTFDSAGNLYVGNYGASTVIVWDRGTWVSLKEPEAALADGELKVRLAGEKLTGGWTLVRLKDDPTNWLLIKERDPSARPLAEYDVLVEAPAG